MKVEMTHLEELVTILTLNYNNPHLYTAIDSVISQTYGNIQYIIVDDSSDEFNEELVRNYVSERQQGNIKDLIIIRNEQNVGIIKSSNKALEFAHGKYIFNLAGDDAFYDSTVIKDWVALFDATQAQIITARRAIFDEKMNRELAVLPELQDEKLLMEGDSKKIWNRLCESNFIFGCTTARTLTCFEQLGGYSEDYRYIDDYPWNLKAVRMKVPIIYWPRKAIKYRFGGISSPSRFDYYYLKDSIMILIKEILPYSTNRARKVYFFSKWLFIHLKNKYFANLKIFIKKRRKTHEYTKQG